MCTVGRIECVGDGGGKLESFRVNYFACSNVKTNESTQHAKLLFSDA